MQTPAAPVADVVTPLPEATGPCTENGCLRSHRFVGRYTKSAIEPLLSPGVVIDNGYAIYTIRYLSGGGEVGATIAVPTGVAPAGGWHAVVNNHGTTGIADACAITGTTWGSGLAGELGARGLIGVAPDYHGLGAPGVHPYLVSESEGRNALDAARATIAFANTLDVPFSKRFAIVGLSQGGHAALGAAAEHATYAPDVDVRAFAAAGPATVREEDWWPALSIDGPHIAYVSLVAYAWWKVYKAPHSPFKIDVEATMEEACAFTPWPTVPLLLDRLPQKATELFTDEFLAGSFHEYFDKNRVRAYTQTAPLRIYQGDADTTVPEPQTRAAVDDLRAGGVEVEYVVAPGGGHTDVAFSFVAQKQSHTADAVQWLKDRLQ